VLSLSAADAQFLGEAVDDKAGYAVSAGDLDGDDLADVLLGSPFEGSAAGAVYLVYGYTTGDVALSGADAKLMGVESGDFAGMSLTTGDIDADGVRDAVVGAPYAATVYVVSGAPTGATGLSGAAATIVGESEAGEAGTAIASGDVSGDGVDDLLIGAPTEGEVDAPTGVAYVLEGTASGTVDLSEAAARIAGISEGDQAGSAVACGDVGGDGIGDLLIGAVGANTVYLFRGPASGSVSLAYAEARFTSDGDFESIGSVVSSGDIDGDGRMDILIGSATSNVAFLVYGPISGTQDLWDAETTFMGESSGDKAGWSMASGDLNGDDVGDVLVGATYDDAGAANAGAVYLVLGEPL
jgi:hypothetical protein